MASSDKTTDWKEGIEQLFQGCNDKVAAVEKLQKFVKEKDSVPLNIAITGETGSGKSSLVNAFRGLMDDDELAAPTGVVETTKKPKPYPHPDFPSVVLWDLPGIGSPTFKPSNYLTDVNFSQYDFFIIVASERFKVSCMDLAAEIKKMKKNFYFVRTKIDNDIKAEKRKRNFSQDRVLKQIQEDAVNGLKNGGVERPMVFLISNHELRNYDFACLVETLRTDLPQHKHEMFASVVPNISESILQAKMEALKARVWGMALLSAVVAAVPIPGLSIAVDTTILVCELIRYRTVLGLDKKSLENLSRQTEVPLEELNVCLKSPLNVKIDSAKVVDSLKAASLLTLMTAEELIPKLILPVIGSIIASGMSFSVTKYMLGKHLDELYADAKRVLEKILEKALE